jgi:hypothetical protein
MPSIKTINIEADLPTLDEARCATERVSRGSIIQRLPRREHLLDPPELFKQVKSCPIASSPLGISANPRR